MTTVRQSQEKAYQKYAWLILVALSVLLVVNMVIVAGFEDHAAEFAKDTGTAWDTFATAYPGVAAAYTLNLRTLFVSFGSLGLFALVLSWFGLRQGQRWAWYGLWLLPITMALVTLLFAQSRRPELGAIYAGFAVLAAIGLLLPIRKFFPKAS